MSTHTPFEDLVAAVRNHLTCVEGAEYFDDPVYEIQQSGARVKLAIAAAEARQAEAGATIALTSGEAAEVLKCTAPVAEIRRKAALLHDLVGCKSGKCEVHDALAKCDLLLSVRSKVLAATAAQACVAAMPPAPPRPPSPAEASL